MKDMTTEEIENHAAAMKNEAVKLLNGMFKLPEGVSSNTIQRIVDCIIGAAVLEISAAHQLACEMNKSGAH